MFTATQTAGVVAQDINQYDADAIRNILAEAKSAAKTAAQSFLDDWNEKTGGTSMVSQCTVALPAQRYMV